MMFYGAMMQSGVASQTIASYSSLRNLTRADVRMGPDSLTITIKAAKNLQRHDQQRVLTVVQADDPGMCLLHAVQLVLGITPTQHPNQPMFVFIKTAKPIPVSLIRRHWQAALKAVGTHPSSVTLHTLRKAAVTTAFDQG